MKTLCRSRVMASLFGLAAALAVQAKDGPAYEKVTLETRWTNITCTVTLPGGASTTAPCNGLSFTAVVPPGGTASISATLNWTYTDDGLALARPFAFQLDPFGFVMQPVDHESALIVVQSRFCNRTTCPPPEINYVGPGYVGFVLGSNDVPDALEGSRVFTASATLRDTFAASEGASVFLGSFTIVQQVAAIPEPSTPALLLAGLIGVVALGRRRACGQQARSSAG